MVEQCTKVVKEDWSDRVVQFIDSIERGAYRREFKYKAHKVRCTYQCSQVSELFSLFRQAIHYNDYEEIFLVKKT